MQASGFKAALGDELGFEDQQEALVVSKQGVEAGCLAAGVPPVEDVAFESVSRGVDDPEVSLA